MKITKISDIVPLINEQGMTVKEVSKLVKRSEPTVWVWVRKLREAGYTVNTKPRGRKALEI